MMSDLTVVQRKGNYVANNSDNLTLNSGEEFCFENIN